MPALACYMYMETREHKTAPSPSVPALFLLLLLLTRAIGSGLLMAHGGESAALDLLHRVGLLWSLVWWLEADGRRRGVRQVYCLGLLTMVGGLILLPYHLFKTRGGAGLLLILAFFGALIACMIVSAVVYVACGGLSG